MAEADLSSDDLETADRWFEKHARSSVLFGRCAPVVRSLVSIPAGANHMPLGLFVLFRKRRAASASHTR